MAKGKGTRNILLIIRCAVASVFLFAAAVFAFPALRAALSPVLPVFAAAGFLLAIGDLGLFFVLVARPAAARAVESEKAEDELAKLTAGIARLGTGDLAVNVPQAAGVVPGIGLRGIIRDGVADFNGITSEPCARLFYVGTDSYAEGCACGAAAMKMTGNSGTVGIIVSDLQTVNQNLRRKGFLGALRERGQGLSEAGTAETFRSPEKTYAATEAFIKAHRDLRAVYIAEGNTPSAAAKAVEDAGLKGKVLVFSHDLNEGTMEYLRRGVITATISQDPYAQGYDPVIRLFNAAVSEWRPLIPRLLTKLEAVTLDNYSSFWDPVSGILPGDPQRLAAPSGKRPERRLRIAVVNFTSAGFWKPVKQGVLDAAKTLEPLNASVEWIGAAPSAEGGLKASTFAPVLERLSQEGYDCVALPVFDRALVPALNRAASRGMAIATLNSEPVSLREMLMSVSSHADLLISLSQELAASSTESGQSTTSMGVTMSRITESLKLQAKETDRTGKELLTLIENIEKAKNAARESSDMAKRVATASGDGLQAVSRMRKTMAALEEASNAANSAMKVLHGDTLKISSIVASIADIVGQTNVLAINASIQAARAGEGGKGFAVVAGEIRNLAAQTDRLAADIGRLVSGIQARSKAALEAADRGFKQAKENAESAEMSENSLTAISRLADENETRLRVILEAAEEMSAFSRGIEETIRSLSAANAQGEEAIDDVSMSMSEMSTLAAGVSNAAQSLLEMARAQIVLLSQFRLGG